MSVELEKHVVKGKVRWWIYWTADEGPEAHYEWRQIYAQMVGWA